MPFNSDDNDPAPAGFTGFVISAIVVLGTLIAFLMFGGV